ncbi:MAG: CO dehydrogenase/acetyl-CoA synthase subunit delta [Candidatus Omnitrophica bacterium]|nr:CO dehydrogenase/acetyl-CoA synthase subunit delta [Candidatus Omnitrophota bacterium]
MPIDLMLEKYSGRIATLTIGASKEEAGTRKYTIRIGGQTTLPFLFSEGPIPNKPTIAFEIWDIPPIDWPQALLESYKDVVNDTVEWAQKCIEDYRAKVLCLRLQGAHPDCGNRTPDEEAKLIEKLLKAVDVPLIIIGCGEDTKDNLVLPICSQAAKGERCLFGEAFQDNYKTLTAAVLADGHNIIATSPIDINIAKQLNILISDMGLGLERIVINPTIGALGYGLEYAYSIMERIRLAALAGDKTVAMPFICFVGQEAWRAKEAKASAVEFPNWGKDLERGIVWETLTATALIQAGGDIMVMRHPKAAQNIDTYIEELMQKSAQ